MTSCVTLIKLLNLLDTWLPYYKNCGNDRTLLMTGDETLHAWSLAAVHGINLNSGL